MAIFHRLALTALILVWTSHSPVGAVPSGRAGGGLAAIFSRNAASSSSSSTASTQPMSSSSTASTGTNAQPSNRKKDSVPYLQEYLRDWVTTQVPMADNEGHLYLNPKGDDGKSARGRKAEKGRLKTPYNKRTAPPRYGTTMPWRAQQWSLRYQPILRCSWSTRNGSAMTSARWRRIGRRHLKEFVCLALIASPTNG